MEVSKSSQKSQKILEALNSSRKFQAVLGNLRQFPVVSMSCWGLKNYQDFKKNFGAVRECLHCYYEECGKNRHSLTKSLNKTPEGVQFIIKVAEDYRAAAYLKLNCFVGNVLGLCCDIHNFWGINNWRAGKA